LVYNEWKDYPINESRGNQPMHTGRIILRFIGASLIAVAFASGDCSVLAAPFHPDDWSVFERDSASSHTADVDLADEANASRLRIPLTIKGFERVPAAGSGAAANGARDVTIARRAQHFNLKARMDRPNHFYFGDWHFETLPTGKTPAGEVQIKMSLSRTFGEDHELEEHVGDMHLQGGIARSEPGVYEFIGKSGARFTGRSGDPLVEIQVNGGQARDHVPPKVSRLDPRVGVKPVDTAPAR
jgi:hypothetical protein